MRRKPRRFDGDQPVEVQSEVGATWESATYRDKVTDMRGWHRVELSRDRLINSMNGCTTTADDPQMFRTRIHIVPTQRIRARAV